MLRQQSENRGGKNIALLTKRNHLTGPSMGDIQGDYDAASSAGSPFIHAAYGFGKISAEVPKIQDWHNCPRWFPYPGCGISCRSARLSGKDCVRNGFWWYSDGETPINRWKTSEK